MASPVAVQNEGTEPTRVDGAGAGPPTRPLPLVESLGRGSVLAGKYRLELLLGEGGMGFVWSAYNTELELPVAIKLLRAGSSSATLVERLRLEGRAAARLVHPSVVRIFDIALTDAGDPFIVMELLSGENLAQRLTRGRLRGIDAVQLLLPIADALALAHGKGIVHRDLKPDNVFISREEGQELPKLLDFGIAKRVYGSTWTAKLTGRGTLLGSPSYMSPEQARGEDVDERTDVWSFCVVLYEAISGRPPFWARDKRAVIRSVMSDVAVPPLTGPSVDPELSQLVAWGLRKDREERPRSMRELGQHLARWLRSQGITEDAAGTSLSAKWAVRLSEPSPEPSQAAPRPIVAAAPTLASRRASDVTVPFIRPPVPPVRRRYWGLLAAASLLLVGSSAWTASAPEPSQPATTAASRRPLELAETTIIAAPAIPEVTRTLTPVPPDEAEAQTRPAPRQPRKRTPAPQLPF